MIEDAMLFGLGFCVATLIALLCLPLVWGRATRLVRRRLEQLVPLSMAEVEAERDGLRANAAVAQRRLEQKLDHAIQRANEAAVEGGRRVVHLVQAERARDAFAIERDAVTADLAATRSSLAEREQGIAALASKLEGSERRIADLEIEGLDRQKAYDAARAEAQDLLVKVSNLESAKVEAESRIAMQEALIDRGRDEQAALRDALTERGRERDAARNDVLEGSLQRTMLQKQLLDEARRTEDYSVRWMAKAEALASAERRMVEQVAELKTSAAALADLKRSFDALEARLIASVTMGGGDVDVSDGEIASLRAAVVGVADEAIRVLHGAADLGEGDAPSPSGPMPAASAMVPHVAGSLF